MKGESPEPESATSWSGRRRLRWDIFQFIVFVLVTAPHATGETFHEWAGLALVPILVVHLVSNWDWIVDKTRNMLGRLPGEVRFNHVWNSLMFIVATLAIMSGILCSRSALGVLGIRRRPDFFWAVAHTVSATVLIALVGVHLGVHFRWVIARFRRSPANARPPSEDPS